MATTQIPFDDQKPGGRLMRRFLNALQDVLQLGKTLNGCMPKAIDGDSDDAASYTLLSLEMGTASNADAKALFDEFGSCYSKFSGDGSVTSVNAALQQMLDKTAIGRTA